MNLSLRSLFDPKKLILIPALSFSSFAQGWGQYGHEAVNQSAIDLLSTSDSIGACFQTPAARYLVTRYAVTPDIEWKTDMSLPNLDSEDKLARRDNDCYEHPLHFFEADAFVTPSNDQDAIFKAFSIESLSGDYRDVAFKEYSKMMASKINYILTVDPSKAIESKLSPTTLDVSLHGTAPWRARSLYLASVEAMKKKDFQLAALYLGSMGHYVGDMSQPFHTTLNFNGGFPAEARTVGIHHEIDTGLFETLWTAKQKKNHTQKDANDVYNSFENTKADVQSTAEVEFKQIADLNEANIVATILERLVASGYPEVESLLKAYQQECTDANSTIASKNTKKRGVASKAPSTEKYCVNIPIGAAGKTKVRSIGIAREKKLSDYSLPPTILKALEMRLGKSSAILAKLWISAWKEAGQPAFGDCSTWKFDQSYAIKNYLKPDYYPVGFNGKTKSKCHNDESAVEREPGSAKAKPPQSPVKSYESN